MKGQVDGSMCLPMFKLTGSPLMNDTLAKSDIYLMYCVLSCSLDPLLKIRPNILMADDWDLPFPIFFK